MSIYMSPIEYTLSDSPYDVYANLQVGSNGDPYGDPTSDVGDATGEENWAYSPWDTSLVNGFDTGNVYVSYDVNGNGSQSLSVGNDAPVSYEGAAIGTITSVILEAAVQTNAVASWSNVSVEFLKAGSVVETVNPSNGPGVDTISTGSPDVEEQTLTITPSAANDDEVIVSGMMRMASPGISYPAAQSMFCNIFVNATTNTVAGNSGEPISYTGIASAAIFSQS